MRNQSFHVLNDRWQECPVWVVGELFIGGVGLAEGYWGDPDRTAASFVVHPVSGERLYRTGDLGRWLPDGVIEFCGRDDFQVKVGGFRIELGEVEHVLAGCPGVRAVVVAAVGERHHRRLAGYVVPVDEGGEGDVELGAAVRAHAAAHLPHYMVPHSITVLDRLPLTPNGKVDRTHLPDPDAPTTEYTPPRTPVERTVAEKLSQLLGTPQVCVRANFFELGLDSVLVVRMHRELQTALGRDFPLTLFFEHPSVRSLANSFAGAGDRDAALDAAFARGQRNRQRRRAARRGQEETTA
jgi:hypothetical protein